VHSLDPMKPAIHSLGRGGRPGNTRATGAAARRHGRVMFSGRTDTFPPDRTLPDTCPG